MGSNYKFIHKQNHWYIHYGYPFTILFNLQFQIDVPFARFPAKYNHSPLGNNQWESCN